MVKDDQINFAVESEQKEKWQEHAENQDQYDNLTNLIISAVEERISTDTEEYNIEDAILSVSDQIGNIEGRLAEIEDLNREIKQTQANSLELKESMDQLETIVKTRVNNED